MEAGPTRTAWPARSAAPAARRPLRDRAPAPPPAPRRYVASAVRAQQGRQPQGGIVERVLGLRVARRTAAPAVPAPRPGRARAAAAAPPPGPRRHACAATGRSRPPPPRCPAAPGAEDSRSPGPAPAAPRPELDEPLSSRARAQPPPAGPRRRLAPWWTRAPRGSGLRPQARDPRERPRGEVGADPSRARRPRRRGRARAADPGEIDARWPATARSTGVVVDLHRAHAGARPADVHRVARGQGARPQRAGDHRADPAERERAVDVQQAARRLALRAAGQAAAARSSAASSSSRPSAGAAEHGHDLGARHQLRGSSAAARRRPGRPSSPRRRPRRDAEQRRRTARCSRVCGITPSSAATTSRKRSMPVAPATIVRTKRSWPGTSTTDRRRPVAERRAGRSRGRS